MVLSTMGRPTTLTMCSWVEEAPATWSIVKCTGSGEVCSISVSTPVCCRHEVAAPSACSRTLGGRMRTTTLTHSSAAAAEAAGPGAARGASALAQNRPRRCVKSWGVPAGLLISACKRMGAPTGDALMRRGAHASRWLPARRLPAESGVLTGAPGVSTLSGRSTLLTAGVRRAFEGDFVGDLPIAEQAGVHLTRLSVLLPAGHLVQTTGRVR